MTYDGVRMRVGPTSDEELERIVAAGGRRGEIYAAMRDLRDRYVGPIRERYPDIPRRVSGYSLDALLPENGFDVARALVGSEGTLATVLEARLRLVHMPRRRSLVVLGYPTMADGADGLPEIMSHAPIAVEAIDERLVRNLRLKGIHSTRSLCSRRAAAGCSSSSAARRRPRPRITPAPAWPGSHAPRSCPR